MKIGVLALQGDFREHLAMLRSLGADACPVRLPEEVEQIDGLIIPGGESTTMGKLMVSYGVDRAIVNRFNGGKLAIYGTCAGMILLARDIEGYLEQPRLGLLDVCVQRNAFGRQKESGEDDLIVEGLATPIHAVFIRAPVIVRTGPTVSILAKVAQGPVYVQQGRLLASSFHPELGSDTRVHEHFLQMAAHSSTQEV
ncbi:MAG: pyridoxal 5'-phosphate synthase glutaminase subunit PdxT [Candidatus Cryosericum sp.]